MIAGAAWATPAIALAAAVPALAASGDSAGAFVLQAVCFEGGRSALYLTPSPTLALPPGTLVTLTGQPGDSLMVQSFLDGGAIEQPGASPWSYVLEGGLASGGWIIFRAANPVTSEAAESLTGIVTLPSGWTGEGSVATAVVYRDDCSPGDGGPGGGP